MKYLLLSLGFVLLLIRPESALGYCGATTCGVSPDDTCGADELGCPEEGAALAWPLGRTITIACSKGCDDAIERALTQAVGTWQDVACDGEQPGILLVLEDAPPENQERDLIVVEATTEGWRDGPTVAGRTIVEFGTTSGTLFRATIALNAEEFVFGFERGEGDIDAQAVLTHELGHALGLAHSSVSGATMQAEASAGYATEFRTLLADDEAGLCALYPPAPPDPGAGGEGGRPGPSAQGSHGCVLGYAAPSGDGMWRVAALFAIGLGHIRRRGLGVWSATNGKSEEALRLLALSLVSRRQFDSSLSRWFRGVSSTPRTRHR